MQIFHSDTSTLFCSDSNGLQAMYLKSDVVFHFPALEEFPKSPLSFIPHLGVAFQELWLPLLSSSFYKYCDTPRLL